jgi:hypothetical protein
LPNGWRLSGEGGEADRVRCSRGLGNALWTCNNDLQRWRTSDGAVDDVAKFADAVAKKWVGRQAVQKLELLAKALALLRIEPRRIVRFDSRENVQLVRRCQVLKPRKDALRNVREPLRFLGHPGDPERYRLIAPVGRLIKSIREPTHFARPHLTLPNGWRLSGEGGEADRVRCSRGLGGQFIHATPTLAPRQP